jgi:hypothetical protein
MDEHIFLPLVRLDEARSFVAVVEFNDAKNHEIPFYDRRRHKVRPTGRRGRLPSDRSGGLMCRPSVTDRDQLSVNIDWKTVRSQSFGYKFNPAFLATGTRHQTAVIAGL